MTLCIHYLSFMTVCTHPCHPQWHSALTNPVTHNESLVSHYSCHSQWYCTHTVSLIHKVTVCPLSLLLTVHSLSSHSWHNMLIIPLTHTVCCTHYSSHSCRHSALTIPLTHMDTVHSLSLSLTLTQCAHYPSHSQRHSMLTIPLTHNHIVCSLFLLFITIKYAHIMTQCTRSHSQRQCIHSLSHSWHSTLAIPLTHKARSLPFSLLI